MNVFAQCPGQGPFAKCHPAKFLLTSVILVKVILANECFRTMSWRSYFLYQVLIFQSAFATKANKNDSIQRGSKHGKNKVTKGQDNSTGMPPNQKKARK
jgi:hypothetical protein